MRRLAGAMACLAFSASAQAQPMDAFGITLGEPMAIPPCMATDASGKQVADFSLDWCVHTGRQRDFAGRAVDWRVQFSSSVAPPWVGNIYANKAPDSEAVGAVLILLAPDADEDQVIRTLVKKYGKPTSNRPDTYRNALGAVFTEQFMLWEGKRAVITYSGPLRINEKSGWISIQTRAVADAELARHREQEMKRRGL